MQLMQLSECPADIQQVLVVKEEQQDRSLSLDRAEPELLHIKEEPKELRIKGEQLQELEETDVTSFTFTSVHVKTEDDRENVPSSQTVESREKPDGDHGGGSDSVSCFHPQQHFQTHTEDSSDTEDSDDWTQSSEPESHLNKTSRNFDTTTIRTIKNDDFPVTHIRCKKKKHHCSECGKTFGLRSDLKRHTRVHTGEKPFCCSECGARFTQKSSLVIHTRVHTGEKPFCCSVCKKCFSDKSNYRTHMTSHTGEKHFGCSYCGKKFSVKASLVTHSRVHTGEKPFSCSVCKKCFSQKSHVNKHMKIHES